jgi:hypothetical protein
MAGPWEKYQATATAAPAAAEGPWSRYKAAAPAEAQPNVIEEMHPDITSMDRILVKNFSNDPQAAAAYLAQKHPGLEVKAQPDGKIIARKPGEKDYRVLDPDTGFFSKDFLHDVGDVLYDVPAGLVQSAATGAGGLAGNLPGAALAGGASAAGLETLRQAVGNKLGINDGVKGGDVLLSGGVGAVAPVLFGSGVGGKEALKALGRGATDVLTEGELATLKGQEGLLRKGLSLAGEKAGALADKVGEVSGSGLAGKAVVSGGKMAAGALAGELLGHDHKAAALGAALTSPYALRALQASGRGATGVAAHVYDNATPAVMSAWQALLQRRREGQ